MKTSLKLAILQRRGFCGGRRYVLATPAPCAYAIGSILAATILFDFGSIATAEQIRGVVAIIYDGTNVSSLASSIAIGKNTAAATGSIVGNEAASSAVGGGGILTVTNPNTLNVGYNFVPESTSSLGTNPTNPNTSIIENINSNNPGVITIIP